MAYGSFYPVSEAVFLWQHLEFETLQEPPFLLLNNKLFRETAELVVTFFFFTVRRFQEIFFSKSAVGKKKRKNVSSNTPFSYLLSHFKQVSHCVSAHIFPNPKSKNLK